MVSRCMLYGKGLAFIDCFNLLRLIAQGQWTYSVFTSASAAKCLPIDPLTLLRLTMIGNTPFRFFLDHPINKACPLLENKGLVHFIGAMDWKTAKIHETSYSYLKLSLIFILCNSFGAVLEKVKIRYPVYQNVPYIYMSLVSSSPKMFIYSFDYNI